MLAILKLTGLRFSAVALSGALWGLSSAPALAVTPDSPEVKELVDRGLKWLQSQNDDRLGGKCLIGLSFFKAGAPKSHSKITAAQVACESALNTTTDPADNYSVGLALIFLLETDPTKNRQLAERYVAEILRRQQAGGGWSYPSYPTGDTSQTQYPTLGLWLAMNHGLEVPITALEKACNWLLRTQDPRGGWGYQGNDPGNFQRVEQSDVRVALTSAGLGSLYICADALGLNDGGAPTAEIDRPSALKPAGEEKRPKRRFVSKAVDASMLRRAITEGNYWISRNSAVDATPYNHYYLYALERYQSFRELAERKDEAEPKWYNDVVAYLKKTQQADGRWAGEDTDVIATSFSVLVLLRSARKTIGQRVTDLGKGILLGGIGLPPNTADLREREGKLVETPLIGSFDELLALIEKPGNSDLDRLALSREPLKLDSDVTKRSGQIARLRELVSAGAFESRLVAVRALSRVRDFDNVPLLIYALSDPEPRIVFEADKGLRFISRKFDGVGLPAEPKPEEVKAAIAAWKTWYLSLRPTATFLD